MELVKQASDHPRPEVPAQPADPNAEASSLHGSLKFEAQRCAYYHGMRARFFDSFGKTISLVSFVAGAGAFSSLIQGVSLLVSILAIITAFFSGLNLIVGFARKGRDHEVLRSKYYGVLVEIEKARDEVAKLREIQVRLLGFYADGTIFLSALDMMATNRTAASLGLDDYRTYVPWLHRTMAHVWSFTGYYVNGKRPSKEARDRDAVSDKQAASATPVEGRQPVE